MSYDVGEVLVNKYMNEKKLNFISFYKNDNYFYGWFEDNDSYSADGVVIARINLKTKEIEESNVLIAPIKWNINYDDFSNALTSVSLLAKNR